MQQLVKMLVQYIDKQFRWSHCSLTIEEKLSSTSLDSSIICVLVFLIPVDKPTSASFDVNASSATTINQQCDYHKHNKQSDH